MKKPVAICIVPVEGVIQTTTGLVGIKANLNLPTASTYYRGRDGLSPQRMFCCSDLSVILIATLYHFLSTLSRLAWENSLVN